MPAPLLDLVYGADPRQRLDLFLPDKPAPRLFVFVHGGGWRGGWRDASPLQHVASGAPPFFLAHAEFDDPGADAQARAMAAALERAGAAARCISIPGRDHVSILAGVRSLFDPLALSLAMFLRAAV